MAKKPKIIQAADGEYDADVKAGMRRPRAITGAVDPTKTRLAKKVATGAGGFGGGREREAGMMIDFVHMSAPYSSGYKLDTYRSSYAFGLGDRTGAYDVPTYFVMMNQQNGGLLYWPVTLMEKYSWYRYWARSDAYVGRALELLSDLPMSKLTLNMPKMPKKMRKIQQEIMDFFNYQLDVINMFEMCQSILWEYNCIGNVYIFMEWDDEKKMWSRAVMLPPEEVYIFQYPFSENKRVEYRPERLIRMIRDGATIVAGMSSGSATESNVCQRGDLEEKILENLPQELIDMVRTQGCIVMDTDPTTGSFVHHIARRKSPYLDLGASVLERILVPMLQREHYKYCQLSLASRNMTPKNVVTAPGLMPEDVDELRTQVDLSYLDPEYSVITNYEVNWQQIGASERMLDFDREYERIENQIFAAMGVTRELMTGEGTFTGSKITVEILNTMFLMSREILKNFIERKLFIPICEAHGWFEKGKNGVKKYWYPQVGFNRITIRDNAEVFDSLFQLYQKGSLPVDIIYELFNLNVDEINAKLRNDLFTVKDPTSNRMNEEVNAEVGRKLVDRTDVVERVAKYLGFKLKPAEGEAGLGGLGEMGGEPSGGTELAEGFADLQGEPGTPPVEVGEEGQVTTPAEGDAELLQNEPEVDAMPAKETPAEGEQGAKPNRTDALADVIHDNLPEGADAEDIAKIVDKVSELEDSGEAEQQ